MVYTKHFVAFSHHGNQDVIDIIPLVEIISVKEFTLEKDSVPALGSDPETDASETMLEVSTRSGGYNSGLVYQIRAKSRKTLSNMSSDLQRLTRAAMEKAEAKSKFKKLQEKVAHNFNSDFTQGILALLICAVSFSSCLTRIELTNMNDFA